MYYGEKFKVDESYPTVMNVNSYADKVVGDKFKRLGKDYQYPSNLWLAIIHSVPSRMERVQFIRETWCQRKYQNKFGFKCIFVFVPEGKTEQQISYLLKENETYHDFYFLTMPDLEEGWYTLAQKNLIAQRFGIQQFPEYQFYSRIDDESVVNVDIVADYLLSIKDPTASVIGLWQWNYQIKPDPEYFYFDPLGVNVNGYAYPYGCLEIFSRDVTEFLVQEENYYNIPPSCLEDNTIGLLLYRYTKVKSRRIKFLEPAPTRFGGEEYEIANHDKDFTRSKKYWELLIRKNKYIQI